MAGVKEQKRWILQQLERAVGAIRQPDEWNLPGGDFDAEVLASADPQRSNERLLSFAFDVTKMQEIVDNPVLNRGFLLQNDANLGHLITVSVVLIDGKRSRVVCRTPSNSE